MTSRNSGIPLHLQAKRLSSPLSEELMSKYECRSLPLRKGDSVKVIRGEYKGVEGKVTRVFRGEGRIAVEGVNREKIAGGNVPVKIHASKVMITTLKLDDKWRREKLETRASARQVT